MFPDGLTYGIRQSIGPTKKPHFDISRMSFYHTLKMCARNDLLLIRLSLWSLMSLRITCVTVYTLSLEATESCRCMSQTTALTWSSHSSWVSTSHLRTNYRASLASGYTQEASKQLEAGTQVEVQVDTQKGLLEADLEIFKTWVKMIQLYLYGIPYIVYKFDRILLINHEPRQNN